MGLDVAGEGGAGVEHHTGRAELSLVAAGRAPHCSLPELLTEAILPLC